MPKNILILFTDQQRRDTIHALGNDAIQTPALDSLANCADVYDRAYTPSPVCVPARMSMLSGQYPARTGCTNNNLNLAYDGKGLYATLTEAGYQSCCVGKMHHVTDYYGSIGFAERHTQEELSHPDDDYTKFILENYPEVFDYNGVRGEMYYVPQISQLPPKAHPTQWVGDRSVEFIERVDEDKPFFLFSSFIHPHPPFCPPAPWNKIYREELDPPFRPDLFDEFAPLLHKRFGTTNMGTSDRDLYRLKNHYYACVSFVDYQIGRILDALKARGLYEDTLIVFATDHGEMLGDYGVMGKRTMLEPAAHIPFMVKRPGQTAQTRRDDLASLVDLAPTLLSYAGIGYDPAEFDGIDLYGEQPADRLLYAQYATGDKGGYMVTDGDRKLIYNAPNDRYYYFDAMPEVEDKYDPTDPAVQVLKEKLDAYRASEVTFTGVAKSAEGATGGSGNKHYPARMDHVMRRAEEAGALPAGYTIDL